MQPPGSQSPEQSGGPVPAGLAGARQAAASSEYAAAVSGHIDYYARLLAEQAASLTGAGRPDGGRAQICALALLSVEAENLHAALEAALDDSGSAALLVFARCLIALETRRARAREAQKAYRKLLAQARERPQEPLLLAWSLTGLGAALSSLHDLKPACECLEEARQLFEAEESAEGSAYAGMYLGAALNAMGDSDAALALLYRSLQTFEQQGVIQGCSCSLRNIGASFIRGGRAAEAQTALLRSVQMGASVGDLHGESSTRTNLGIVHADAGRFAEAEAQFERSLEIAEILGDQVAAAYAVGNMGIAAELMGEYERALTLARRSLEYSQETGNRDSQTHSLLSLCQISRRIGRLSEALDYCVSSLGSALSIPSPALVAYALQQAGALLFDAGHGAEGTLALCACDQEFARLGIFEADGSSICLAQQQMADEAVLQGRLAPSAYASARDRAQQSPLMSIGAEILALLPDAKEALAAV